MCWTLLDENIGRKKFAFCAPSHKFVGLYLLNWGMYRQTEKKLVKQQYLLHMFWQYGERWPTNGWDRLVTLGHPSKFQRVLSLRFVTARELVQRRSTIRCTMFGRLQGWYTIYRGPTFLEPLLVTEFCQVQNLLCVQVLRSSIGSVTVRHSSSMRQPHFAAWYLHATGRPCRSTLGGLTV